MKIKQRLIDLSDRPCDHSLELPGHQDYRDFLAGSMAIDLLTDRNI